MDFHGPGFGDGVCRDSTAIPEMWKDIRSARSASLPRTATKFLNEEHDQDQERESDDQIYDVAEIEKVDCGTSQ